MDAPGRRTATGETLAAGPPLADAFDAEARGREIEAWAARTAKPGEWFDERVAAAACAFFPTYLRHTEAEWAGRPFHLNRWERAVVRAAFCWKRPDGTRRFRRIYIEIAKKNGKSEFAAGLALLILVGDGEIGGQVYSLAVDKDQAKIVFNKAATMAEMAPPELRLRLDVFKTSIYSAELNAFIKPLSAVPIGKHGFSVTGSVADELHEWATDELADVVHKNTAARCQPLEIEITTAGKKGAGYGWERHEHALKVLAGDAADHELLPVVFAVDPETDDWADERVWPKANPSLPITPKLDFLRSECAAAKGNPRKENNFKRYHLNLWTEQVVRWIPLAVWDLNTETPEDPLRWQKLEDELHGRVCFAGLDMATTRDTTALVLCFPPLAETERWKFLFRCWLPRNNVQEFVNRTRVKWAEWEAAGAMRLTDGNSTDYATVKAQMLRDAEHFQVREIAIDRWNTAQLMAELQDEGAPVIAFGQGTASMSAPSRAFEDKVFNYGFEHGNHPVTRWMIGNVAIKTAEGEQIKPSKEHSGEKIDLVVSAIMAHGRAVVAPKAPDLGALIEKGEAIL